MSSGEAPDLIGLLRETLVQIEQMEGIPPDDPVLADLKRTIVLIIAEFRILKDQRDVVA